MKVKKEAKRLKSQKKINEEVIVYLTSKLKEIQSSQSALVSSEVTEKYL